MVPGRRPAVRRRDRLGQAGPGAAVRGPDGGRALASDTWHGREAGLVEALRLLGRAQGRSGLPAVDDPVGPFWDRPYSGVDEAVVQALEDAVTDPEVRALPRGVGSAEQWSTNVDVLVEPARGLR